MIFYLTTLLLPMLAAAQGNGITDPGPIVLDAAHNATSLVGAWSSGSRAVKTGADFANPANMSFNYPKVTGEAYSFTGDGHFEISRYRMVSNAAEPNCIKAVMYWTHGTYEILANGTINTKANGDGYQLIQDPCTPVSNILEVFNTNETFPIWKIFSDVSQGFKLHLFRYDGSPVAPLFQVSTSPIMLPTERLRDSPDAPAGSGSVRKRSLFGRLLAGRD